MSIAVPTSLRRAVSVYWTSTKSVEERRIQCGITSSAKYSKTSSMEITGLKKGTKKIWCDDFFFFFFERSEFNYSDKALLFSNVNSSASRVCKKLVLSTVCSV